jgi:hypothetical protein
VIERAEVQRLLAELAEDDCYREPKARLSSHLEGTFGSENYFG